MWTSWLGGTKQESNLLKKKNIVRRVEATGCDLNSNKRQQAEPTDGGMRGSVTPGDDKKSCRQTKQKHRRGKSMNRNVI